MTGAGWAIAHVPAVGSARRRGRQCVQCCLLVIHGLVIRGRWHPDPQSRRRAGRAATRMACTIKLDILSIKRYSDQYLMPKVENQRTNGPTSGAPGAATDSRSHRGLAQAAWPHAGTIGRPFGSSPRHAAADRGGREGRQRREPAPRTSRRLGCSKTCRRHWTRSQAMLGAFDQSSDCPGACVPDS